MTFDTSINYLRESFFKKTCLKVKRNVINNQKTQYKLNTEKFKNLKDK